MSNPSFENIDRWFFEYTEGNLSPAQVEQLERFISSHPELQSELDVWKEAQVSPEEIAFSSSSLLKPTPFYANTRILAVLLIGLLFGSYFIYDFVGVQSQYTMSNHDLAVISVEDDDFFNRKISRSRANNKAVENSANDESKTVLFAENKVLDSEKPSNIKKHKQENSSNNELKSTKETRTLKPTEIENDVMIKENKIQENQDLASNNVSSKGLSDVKSYLNRDKLDRNPSDQIALYGNRSKVDVSHNNFRRKVERVLRNIRRMADQPIALRNTKDQYLHVPMMTGYKANFGMVGSVIGNRIQTTSRNQFVGNDNQQVMNTMSWDGYVYALRGGLGIDVSYNNYSNNSIDNYEASLTYSPKFSVNRNVSIEPAVRFKMGAINVDTDSPIIGSEIEMKRSTVLPLFQESTSPTGSQLWYRDVGAGLMLNTKWFYAGVNVDNIGGHYNNFYSSDLSGSYNEDIHLTSLIGTEYQSTTRDVRVSGYVLHQKFGELNEVWAGSNFQWKWIQVGAAVNSNLGYGGSAGIKFEKFSLHYNLDNVYSRLSDEKLLSHQLTMRILLKPSRYAAKFLNM